MLRPKFPLLTDRLLMRPFDDDDLGQLHAMQSDHEVVRFLYWETRSIEEVQAQLERIKPMTRIDEKSDALRLAALRRDSGELVGDYSLRLASREHRQGEIGFITHPAHQGMGFATEGSEVLLRLGFEELGLHRIFGSCDARNTASARVMERLGMRLEAHFRHNEIFKGEWGDELIYAMLADEWAPRHGRQADAVP
ncbi:MAG TPA: GNAT family protein [Candidatus Limnocylindria bacterium]